MAQSDAHALLHDTLTVYRNLSSYRDEGVVNTESRQRQFSGETTFETMFLQPTFFRFAFSRPHPYPPLAHIITRTICGSDGRGAFMWTKHHDSPAQIESSENLSLAVASATGISSGAAHTIAVMLLGEVRGRRFESLENLSIAGKDTFEGATCHVITGHLREPETDYRMYIDSQKLLLRREVSTFAGFTCDEIRRNIRVNEDIDLSLFQRPSIQP